MTSANLAQAPTCLYCGKETKLSKEHYIPGGIGGTRWGRFVCRKCNNEVLSKLDKELAERSPLSLLAAQEIGKSTGFTWDVDHAHGHMLIEARADVPRRAMTPWPQMIFDRTYPMIGASPDDFRQVGPAKLEAIFIRHLLAAFRTLSAERPRMIFERVPGQIPEPYRLPPRVFAARRINYFDNRMHFQCRYLNAGDKRRVLSTLADWRSDQRLDRFEVRRGSRYPPFQINYDGKVFLRSLTKLGLNLLRFACRQTAVERGTFIDAIRLVLGEIRVPDRLVSECGFTHADDIRSLDCPPSCHKFRLMYDQGSWSLYIAFFSGAAGAFVKFPGPCREAWQTMDVVVPVGGRDWSTRESSILQPICVRTEWKDLSVIVPSIRLVNVETTVTTRRGAK
jgi:hypothetical protein